MTKCEMYACAILGTWSLAACGAGESSETGPEHAYLDVHGTVRGMQVDLIGAKVSFYDSGTVDSLTSFESIDEEVTVSIDLAGRFPVGTHVIDDSYSDRGSDQWDSSIANASIGYYAGSDGWQALSSEFSEQYSPITFQVTTSNDEELSGVLTATLLPDEGTAGTAEARLEIRLHDLEPGQNAYGGSGSSSAGGDVCRANTPFSDFKGTGTICTEAPCSQTANSTQDFQPGTCSSSDVKYGCCGIPGGLRAHVFNDCSTSNCESLADWNVTCTQLGGTGRPGACP